MYIFRETRKLKAALRGQGKALRRQTRLLRELEALVKGRTEPRGAGDFRRTVVFAQYPRFAADYERLVSGGCLTETPDGLVWHKSKQSLAEYFGRQESAGKKRHWRDIESLFGVTGLRNSLSRNGDMFKKTSNDYRELMKLLAARSAGAAVPR
ncbi:MAG: hypothetical protein MdMp014T_0876 [Treponematales bacterium]